MSRMGDQVVELAHFRYPTHYTYVYQVNDTGRVHCIKYSQRGMVWEHFDYAAWEECKEYMITDLPDHTWGFSEDPE